MKPEQLHHLRRNSLTCDDVQKSGDGVKLLRRLEVQMMLCGHWPMACLLLPVICLLVAEYRWFRTYEETLVISGVVTSYLSDGALATSKSHGDHESKNGSGGVLSLHHEDDACCMCVLTNESIHPTCWGRYWSSRCCWEDEENESSKLKKEVGAQKSRGAEIRNRGSRELVEGAGLPDRESATFLRSNQSGRTTPARLPRGRFAKLLRLS